MAIVAITIGRYRCGFHGDGTRDIQLPPVRIVHDEEIQRGPDNPFATAGIEKFFRNARDHASPPCAAMIERQMPRSVLFVIDSRFDFMSPNTMQYKQTQSSTLVFETIQSTTSKATY
jgi:hypothetical protein